MGLVRVGLGSGFDGPAEGGWREHWPYRQRRPYTLGSPLASWAILLGPGEDGRGEHCREENVHLRPEGLLDLGAAQLDEEQLFLLVG